MIEDMGDRIHDFEINRILEWNAENIRKYKIFIRNLENPDIMLNLMLLDK